MHLVQAQMPRNSQYVAELGLTEVFRIQSWGKKVAGDQDLQTVFPGGGGGSGPADPHPYGPVWISWALPGTKAGLHLSLAEGC